MSALDLRQATLLGSYPDRDEYQIGRTLVWVQFGTREQQETATDLACLQFPSIWSSIPEVIAEAREASRKELPEFWQVHEEAETANEVLSVWGIWIEPVSGVATYEVSTNHEFLCERGANLPVFPEESHVMVMRSKEGVVSVRADASPGA